METDPNSDTIYIYGRFDCPRMTHIYHIIEDLKGLKKPLPNFNLTQCFESDFDTSRNNFLKEDLKFLQFNQSPIIYLQSSSNKSKTLIGSLEEFQQYLIEHYNYHDIRKTQDYEKETKDQLSKFISDNGNKFVYFDFSIEDEPQPGQSKKLDRVVFVLHGLTCPQTVNNFLSLCIGFNNDKSETVTYKGSIINRVSQYSFIQGGDIECKGNRSVYGKEFNDENYNIKHDAPGIIGMVKKGNRSHSNECQFYITLSPLKSFDKKFVAFGKVIIGLESIKYIENIETDMQRPKKVVKIVDCGEYKID